MANDKNFKVKNGLLAGRYLLSSGTVTSGSVAYNLSAASYNSVSFDFSSQVSSGLEVAFNNDGTKMYILGNNDIIYQYSLSTGFDVSTASYDSVSLNISSKETSARGITFNSNGTKFYVTGSGSDSTHEYALSTAYDLSTASFSTSFSHTSETLTPVSAAFNTDGTKMYILDYSPTSNVYQYSLSTGFDISTASYDSVSFSVETQAGFPIGTVLFSSDGTKMFIVDYYESVIQYTLSTAFDISTASYSNVSFDATSQETFPQGLAFSTDGTKMFVTGTGSVVYQYSTVSYTKALDLSTGNTFSFTPSGATTVSFTNAPASGKAVGFAVEINGDGSAITWPSSVKWPSGVAPTATASKEVYSFVTTDGGTSYYGKLAGSDIA